MGVIHLAPVGTSPGAVTAGLAYIKQHLDEFGMMYDAGAAHPYNIEAVVVFASYAVAEGRRRTNGCYLNTYNSRQSRKSWDDGKGWVVHDVVRSFVERELAGDGKSALTDGAQLFCWPVDVYDFQACFEAIATAVLSFVPPEKQGKLIWANLTGGTNVLNAALLEVAFLSGLIGKMYYTFIGEDEHKKYLQPVTEDPQYFRYIDLPLTKTQFDAHYYAVLTVLRIIDDWCDDSTLHSFLRNHEREDVREYFTEMSLDSFRKQLLIKMIGNELERDAPEGHRVKLTPEGLETLERLDSPLFQALIQRGRGTEVDMVKQYRQERKQYEVELSLH